MSILNNSNLPYAYTLDNSAARKIGADFMLRYVQAFCERHNTSIEDGLKAGLAATGVTSSSCVICFASDWANWHVKQKEIQGR